MSQAALFFGSQKILARGKGVSYQIPLYPTCENQGQTFFCVPLGLGCLVDLAARYDYRR
jgi:hypothetical protein